MMILNWSDYSNWNSLKQVIDHLRQMFLWAWLVRLSPKARENGKTNKLLTKIMSYEMIQNDKLSQDLFDMDLFWVLICNIYLMIK